MKNIYSFLLSAFIGIIAFAQDGAPASPYYNGFNFNQTGTALKNALANKIETTHTNQLSYTPELWNALKVTDLDPDDSSNNYVMLVYGFSNNICDASPSDDNDHRRRYKHSNGGDNTCEWNREHIYPQSLGTPDLGQSGPGSDAHHLRASDVDRNGMRANKRFIAGSGNSGTVGAGWYPGDEWKGDVARILMYMYLRYGSQCLPKNVVISSVADSDNNMPSLLLQWNAEDPVSEMEDNRNTYLGNASNSYGQGNRNPFIDNPYLATMIWGGPVAEDRWGFLSAHDTQALQLAVYPNPSVNHEINIACAKALDDIQLININGQLIQQVKSPKAQNNIYTLHNLPQGFYLLKATSQGSTTTTKVIVN